jgi:8-oxo-dGTP pyrophosphatase MutT (NUDIX family)
VNNPDDWQILEINSLFKNPHVEVLHERVILPGEVRIRDWTVVRRKQAVVIAPLTSQGNFILVHQARIPVRKILWEFPAGQIDDSLEPEMELIRQTALREMTEESGYSLAPGGELILRRDAPSVFGAPCSAHRLWQSAGGKRIHRRMPGI